MTNKPQPLAIRSSAAEYLTYIAATGNSERSFEMRYQDENIYQTNRVYYQSSGKVYLKV
jgi:hypothetical protein